MSCQYRSLCTILVKLASRAAESKDSHVLVDQSIAELSKRVEGILRIQSGEERSDYPVNVQREIANFKFTTSI